MAAASVALLGRTSELTMKSSKSDEPVRRVRLPSLVTGDAESGADMKEDDVKAIARLERLESKASCCSTLATASWVTSRSSCPTQEDLDFEGDGAEEHAVVSLLSFMRVRTDSGLGMPDTPSSMSPASLAVVSVMPRQHADGSSMDRPAPRRATEDGISESDETEEQDVRQASLLSFMRVRTDSGHGMPVSTSSMSPGALAMFSVSWGLHADQGDTDQGDADQVNAVLLQLSDLIGGNVEAVENDKPGADATENNSVTNVTCSPHSTLFSAMLRPCPTPLTPETSSFEPSTTLPVTPPSKSAAVPCSPNSTMSPPTPLCTDSWTLGMMSPAMATTFGMLNVPQSASPKGDGHSYGSQVYSEQYSPAQQSRKRTCAADAIRGVNQNCLPTTVCFRNLPNNYSTKMVLELLDKNGFKDSYDFVYVPHDFKRLPSRVNVGYFFVNFVSHDVAASALDQLVGFRAWTVLSSKVLTGSWAEKTQGRNACIERCKYFTFMHDKVPNECKPMMFEHGVVVSVTS